MTARKTSPKPKRCITLNTEKARLTAQAADGAISVRMAEMLAVMQNGAVHTNTGMVCMLGLNRNGSAAEVIKYNFDRLLDAGLIARDEASTNRTGVRYVITPDGLAALSGKPVKAIVNLTRAEPNKTNMLKRDIYVPSRTTYYRNTGLAHIASHGVQC